MLYVISFHPYYNFMREILSKNALLLTWEGEITCSGLRPRLDGPNRVLFNPLLGYLSCFFVSLLNRQVDPPVTYTFLGSLHLINGIIIIK